MAQWLRTIGIAPYAFRTGIIAGAVVITAGATLGAWGIVTMWRHRTPVEPGYLPVRIVTSGPFRFTRNPLYIGLTAVAAGVTVMVNSAWFIAATVLLWILLDRIVVPREEAAIRRAFGAKYEAYLARVRRWI